MAVIAQTHSPLLDTVWNVEGDERLNNRMDSCDIDEDTAALNGVVAK